MGVLQPWFLLAGAAVAIPLVLHLFHRNRARRMAFPALRYLRRTERDHARQIRFRQLLLLLLRTAILILLVLAGARLFLEAGGTHHPPTALVVILDNSASSSRVVGEGRVLDQLKEVALAGLARAQPDDRVWVLPAGQPWLPAVPVGPEEARTLVRNVGPSAARGDLSASLRRARELLATADLPRQEVHLVSDLQASAFDDGDAPLHTGEEVVVWDPWTETSPPPNRGLTAVEVGGGLPPLMGQRTRVTVEARASDSTEVPVRLLLDGRIRAAGTVPPEGQASLLLPAFSSGWVQGRVEADPDAFRLDDVRHFAFQARPAPGLEVVGNPGPFVQEGIAVLREAGRLAPMGSGMSGLTVATAGEGLATLGEGRATLVLPPSDPAVIPAVNRRLAAAGIPWRYGALQASGAVTLAGRLLPEPLEGVIASRWYGLELEGTPEAPPRTLARADGAPWAAEGQTSDGGRYLLLASPLDPASVSLPVSTRMVRFLDWASGAWAVSSGGPGETDAGGPLTAPRQATQVLRPDGTREEVDGTRSLLSTDQVGVYAFLDADSSVVELQAVNVPPRESLLASLPRSEWSTRLGGTATPVERLERWPDRVFRVRQGPELWVPLLLAALLLLGLESLVAAGGRGVRRTSPRSPAPSHGAS